MSDSFNSRSQWEAVYESICRCSATGITVYSNFGRTTQVIVHEENLEENFGCKVAACDEESYPRYFHLNKGYRVVQFGLVQLRTPNCVDGPFLLMEIQTELKDNNIQTVFFGPPWLLEVTSIGWISLVPTVYNRPIIPNHQLYALSRPTLPVLPVPGIPYTEIYIFETVAKLSNIKALSIQQKKLATNVGPQPYCAGLCIYYMDGSIGTLGQWDGSLTADSKVIYNSTADGPLESLTFQYGDWPETESYITNIVNTSSDPTNSHLKVGRTFHWFASTQRGLFWRSTQSKINEVGFYDSEKIIFKPTDLLRFEN